MKKVFLVFMMYCFLTGIQAQHNMNNALKFRWHENTLPSQFTILVKGDALEIEKQAKIMGYKVNYSQRDILSVTLNSDALSRLIQLKAVRYAEFIEPRKQVMNDTMLVRNRIKPVKDGQFPLTQAYDGTGVIVGIIDTGTDWRHADFKNPDGTTRIQYIWDQKVPGGGQTPQPYGYGIEWTAAQINASLCTHDDQTGNSHGTHVSGVAAGDGSATGKLEGCAPKADLIIVALDFNKAGPTIADAVNYIFTKATAMGKPCVINASLGDYYGSHDGTDLEAQLIDGELLNQQGRVMVAAAGNAGQVRFHTFTQPPANDTSFTWIQKNNNTLYYWCYGDTNQVKNLQFSVGANRANYSNIGRILFRPYNYGIPTLKSDTLKNINGQRIGVIKTSASINTFGVYELFYQIIADTSGLFWRVETKGTGLHHAWNFDFVNTGFPTQVQFPAITKFVKPDSLLSMVSGFQNLETVITVANYINLNKYYDYNNNLQSTTNTAGDRMPSSSIGPTRDGRQKPDIAATGESVFSSLCVGMQANFITNIPQYLAVGGQHVIGGGTSAASPVVAGLAALYLQAKPYADSKHVRIAVTSCAYSDNFTGNTLPNYYWGHGKLDGKAAMLCIVNTGKEDVFLNSEHVAVMPNPFCQMATLHLPELVKGKMCVYSVDGKLLLEKSLNGNSVELRSSELTSFTSGVLLIRIYSDKNNYTARVILNRE